MTAGSATQNGVSVSGVVHSYGDVGVLHEIDLDVMSGSTLALLGPSGCGKTTLLRVIAGLERPQSGQVIVDGVVVASESSWISPDKRQVGMVFQDWALFPQLTVGGNVGYGLPKSQRSGPRVVEALEMVGLHNLSDRMPDTLSGGQQQRVALARALAPRPKVLLLDEPFSNLDSALRLRVRSEVHRLLIDLGVTSIFVTHDQEEAFVLGDSVAVMRDGGIVQTDSRQKIYKQPVNRWVAEFVGTVSTLIGTAAGGVVDSSIGPIPIDSELTGQVEVLIRPEDLSIESGHGGTVEMVEFYGHDSMVFVDFCGQILQVRCDPESSFLRGDQVDIRFSGVSASAFPIS